MKDFIAGVCIVGVLFIAFLFYFGGIGLFVCGDEKAKRESEALRGPKTESEKFVEKYLDTELKKYEKPVFCVKVIHHNPDTWYIKFSNDNWQTSETLNKYMANFRSDMPIFFRNESKAINYAKRFKTYDQIALWNQGVKKLQAKERSRLEKEDLKDKFVQKEIIINCDPK